MSNDDIDRKKTEKEFCLENEKIRLWEILALKESLLSEIIVWLKAKELWEQAVKDIYSLEKLK